MDLNAWLRLISGAFILISVALAVVVSPWFLLLTTFVGANLVQSSFTGWCPMMSILRSFGAKEEIH